MKQLHDPRYALIENEQGRVAIVFMSDESLSDTNSAALAFQSERGVVHRNNHPVTSFRMSKQQYDHIKSLHPVLVEIQVRSIEDRAQKSYRWFSKTIGHFKTTDSPLGHWFLDQERNERLTDLAWQRSLNNGWANYWLDLHNKDWVSDLMNPDDCVCSELPEWVLEKKKTPL